MWVTFDPAEDGAGLQDEAGMTSQKAEVEVRGRGRETQRRNMHWRAARCVLTGVLLIRVSECDSSLFPLRINILLKQEEEEEEEEEGSVRSLTRRLSVRKDR